MNGHKGSRDYNFFCAIDCSAICHGFMHKNYVELVTKSHFKTRFKRFSLILHPYLANFANQSKSKVSKSVNLTTPLPVFYFFILIRVQHRSI